MQLFGFPLQSHSRGICFDTPMASTGTIRPIQGHDKVAKFCSTEGASMDQFVLMDDPPANSYSEKQQSLRWLFT